MERDVLDRDCVCTRVSDVDDDPLGIRLGTDVPHGFGRSRCERGCFWS
jgi:hypothetical protein